MLNLLSGVLIKRGHEVETATNGNQGIEVFEKKELDLAFNDLEMPGMSGWQAAEKVKSINGRVKYLLLQNPSYNKYLNEKCLHFLFILKKFISRV